MNAQASAPARTVTLSPTDGESFVIIGGGVRMLLDGASSGGRACVMEIPVPPGDGPPLHRHEREDELFYILEGRFKFSIDGKLFLAERGAFACAPRGSIHTFKNVGNVPGRMIVTCTPAGIENPFRAVRFPEPGSGRAPLTQEQMVAEFNKHGITFHGPPLVDE